MPVDKAIARKKLILAGERLIAEQGLQGLSLRKVGLEAGQKNTSAAHYHFGTREGLLAAIFEYRLASTEQRRHELLDDDSGTVRAVLRAWILPDVEEVTETEGGSYHARFLANVTNSPEFSFDEIWQQPEGASFGRIAAELRRLLPELPAEIFSMRFGMAMLQSIYAIADQERLQAESATTPALFVSNLIDVMEAIFTAPVSGESELELAGTRRGTGTNNRV